MKIKYLKLFSNFPKGFILYFTTNELLFKIFICKNPWIKWTRIPLQIQPSFFLSLPLSSFSPIKPRKKKKKHSLLNPAAIVLSLLESWPQPNAQVSRNSTWKDKAEQRFGEQQNLLRSERSFGRNVTILVNLDSKACCYVFASLFPFWSL